MKSLKLNKVNQNQLSNQQMKGINGGESLACGCGCCYANSGGSSTNDNGLANMAHGFISPGCTNIWFKDEK